MTSTLKLSILNHRLAYFGLCFEVILLQFTSERTLLNWSDRVQGLLQVPWLARSWVSWAGFWPGNEFGKFRPLKLWNFETLKHSTSDLFKNVQPSTVTHVWWIFFIFPQRAAVHFSATKVYWFFMSTHFYWIFLASLVSIGCRALSRLKSVNTIDYVFVFMKMFELYTENLFLDCYDIILIKFPSHF